MSRRKATATMRNFLLAVVFIGAVGCDDGGNGEMFPDPAFKACVEETLQDYYNNDLIDPNDPDKYSKVKMIGCGAGTIRDIRGIGNMPNVDWVGMSDNQIESLEPLRTLTKLTNLKLNNNKIKDLEPLSGLTELNALYLMDNYLTDLSPLYSCKKITALSVNGNCITDEQQFSDIKAQLPNAGISGDSLAAQTPEKCQ